MTEQDTAKTRGTRRASLARRCMGLALMLCAVGLTLALLAEWGERRAIANAAWRDPADSMQPQAVAQDLAILSLAGVSDEHVLALSMALGELETVRALLAFSLDLTDAQRTDGWLWLAYHYEQASQTERAARAYRLAGNGAILGEDVPSLARIQTLLRVGKALTQLHDKTSAQFYLQQAATIGASAPRLSAYHRRWLLEQLIPALLSADGKRDDWDGLAQAVKRGSVATMGRSISSAGRFAAGIGDAALVLARDGRRAAAAAWLRALTSSRKEGQDTTRPSIQDTLPEALRAALLAEDAAVEMYVAQSGGTQAATLATQETLLRWLALKRRIAAGGAGAGLVPAWEASREAIDTQLSAAWSAWLALQREASGTDSGGARRAIMAVYWGLYPEASVDDLLPTAQSLSYYAGLRLIVVRPGTPPVLGWGR